MAILISMFGRDRGTEAAIKFFVYTFLPSALLLVAIVWLYAKTGTFDFVRLQSILAQSSSTSSRLPAAGALLGLVSISRRLCRQGSGLSPAWLARGCFQRSAHCDGDGGRGQARSLLHPALQSRSLPCAGPPGGAMDDRLGGDRHSLRRTGGAGAEGYEAAGGVLHRQFPQLLHSRHLCFAVSGLDGAIYQILNEGISVGALLLLLGFMYERYGTYEIASYGGLAKRMPHLATLFVITRSRWSACRCSTGSWVSSSSSAAVSPGTLPGSPRPRVGVILSAAYMLWMIQRVFYGTESGMVTDLSP